MTRISYKEVSQVDMTSLRGEMVREVKWFWQLWLWLMLI